MEIISGLFKILNFFTNNDRKLLDQIVLKLLEIFKSVV